jgi:hypothetical protein
LLILFQKIMEINTQNDEEILFPEKSFQNLKFVTFQTKFFNNIFDNSKTMKDEKDFLSNFSSDLTGFEIFSQSRIQLSKKMAITNRQFLTYQVS